MNFKVEVRYVNGHLIEAAPSGWPMMRGDGVDYVDLIDESGNASRIQGCSVYWSYRENGLWVLGGGTVADVKEVVASPDGFNVRRPEHMPDLTAGHVKLGHWEKS